MKWQIDYSYFPVQCDTFFLTVNKTYHTSHCHVDFQNLEKLDKVIQQNKNKAKVVCLAESFQEYQELLRVLDEYRNAHDQKKKEAQQQGFLSLENPYGCKVADSVEENFSFKKSIDVEKQQNQNSMKFANLNNFQLDTKENDKNPKQSDEKDKYDKLNEKLAEIIAESYDKTQFYSLSKELEKINQKIALLDKENQARSSKVKTKIIKKPNKSTFPLNRSKLLKRKQDVEQLLFQLELKMNPNSAKPQQRQTKNPQMQDKGSCNIAAASDENLNNFVQKQEQSAKVNSNNTKKEAEKQEQKKEVGLEADDEKVFDQQVEQEFGQSIC